MGSGSSKHSRSLRDRFQTWSLAYVPNNILMEITRTVAAFARANPDLLSDLSELLNFSYDQARVPGDNEEEQILHLLKQMQKKEVCRGSWCAMYRNHLVRTDNPRCYTIGGMHHFFLKRDIRRAAELFDTNREAIERYYRSKQYPNFVVHTWSILADSVRRCRQRNTIKDLQVFVDWNTLTEDETRLVVVLLRQTQFVTPFVVPRSPRMAIDGNSGEWNRWKQFVDRQISSSSPGAVIIMKYCVRLLQASDEAAKVHDSIDLQNVPVRSRYEAIKFVWLCAYRKQMTVIGVRREPEELVAAPPDVALDFDDEEESEEEADMEEGEEAEEKIASVFPLGCYHLPGEESSFAESLLMCAYLAKRQS